MRKSITILTLLFCVTNSYTQTEQNKVKDTSKLHLKIMGWPTPTWGFAFANPINHIQLGADYELYKGWFVSADFQYSKTSDVINNRQTYFSRKDFLLGIKKRIVNINRYQFSIEADYMKLSEFIFIETKPNGDKHLRGSRLYTRKQTERISFYPFIYGCGTIQREKYINHNRK